MSASESVGERPNQTPLPSTCWPTLNMAVLRLLLSWNNSPVTHPRKWTWQHAEIRTVKCCRLMRWLSPIAPMFIFVRTPRSSNLCSISSLVSGNHLPLVLDGTCGLCFSPSESSSTTGPAIFSAAWMMLCATDNHSRRTGPPLLQPEWQLSWIPSLMICTARRRHVWLSAGCAQGSQAW